MGKAVTPSHPDSGTRVSPPFGAPRPSSNPSGAQRDRVWWGVPTLVRLGCVDQAGPLEASSCVGQWHHSGVEAPQRPVPPIGQRELRG